MACLDTSVLLDLMGRGGKAAIARSSALVERLASEGEPLTTTCFNVGELLVGVYRSSDPAAERDKLRVALDGLRVLEFAPECVELFGSIQAGLLAMGRPAGDMDVLIASVAIRNAEWLVTGNAKHLRGIAGLDLATYPGMTLHGA
ncbi:MAG: hypothetical protein DCC65_12960 [Planctomycetota bacterium]|nr:MAG: hypothetical protein DCC65_12960 [Planctomycetota bacterium]